MRKACSLVRTATLLCGVLLCAGAARGDSPPCGALEPKPNGDRVLGCHRQETEATPSGGSLERHWNEAGVLVSEIERDASGALVRAREWHETGARKAERTVEPGGRSHSREWWPKGQLKREHTEAPAELGGDETKTFGAGGELLTDSKDDKRGHETLETFHVFDDPAPAGALARPGFWSLVWAQYWFFCPNGAHRVREAAGRGSVTACVTSSSDSLAPGALAAAGCAGELARLDGPFVIRDASGAVTERCAYRAGRLDGTHTSWGVKGAGRVRVETFRDGALDGPFAEWWPNRARARVGEHRRGKQHGLWVTYDANGRRTEQQSWREGKRHGEWLQFAYDQSLQQRSHYANGRLDGPSMSWDEFGRRTREDGWANGRLEGPSREWEDGVLRSETVYAEGRRSGAAKEYWPNGPLSARGEYLEGERTGEWQHFYADGALYGRGRYRSGQRVGHWIFFWPGGVKWSEGDYASCERALGEVAVLGEDGRRRMVSAEGSCRTGDWTFFAKDGHRLGVIESARSVLLKEP